MNEKKRDWDTIVEFIIVIMLGITALLTAWASWIGSLHGGNQSTNYTTSNNLASEGNSEYNAGVQQMNQDMMLWNDISDMQMEILFAQNADDELTVEKTCYQLFYKLDENLSGNMENAINWSISDDDYNDPTATILNWMDTPESMTSPFFDQAYVDTYFVKANDLLEQSQEALEQGREDNVHGDAFGLVTVIFSVVLFLLGIANSFKNKKTKYAVVGISFVALIIAVIYMNTLPLPTGFSMSTFLGG